MAGNGWNGWRVLERAGNGWNWLGMAENGWNGWGRWSHFP